MLTRRKLLESAAALATLSACAPAQVLNTIPPFSAPLPNKADQVSLADDTRSAIKGNPSSGRLHPFVVSERYIRAGGQPVTLSELEEDPRKWFRSEKAYETLKYAFELHVGRLTDAQFKELLGSDRVSVRDCQRGEKILTTGTDSIGNIAWFTRKCVPGEQLLLLNGVEVSSMGCLNPINALIPKTPAYPAPCSEWHPLPEVPSWGKAWFYAKNPEAVKLCNPGLIWCRGCQSWLRGEPGRLPVPQDLLDFLGDVDYALETSQRPLGIWTNPGTVIFYCLEEWGRGDRVDPLPAGPPPKGS